MSGYIAYQNADGMNFTNVSVANPLPVASASSPSGDMAIHGVDATGAPPTAAPVYVGALDESGNVAPLHTTGGRLEAINVGTIFWNETATPLAASATFNGASRDTGVAPGAACMFGYFNAVVNADQVGTVSIQCSANGTTWVNATPAETLTADVAMILQVPVMSRYHRVVVENSGTPQGALLVNSGYSAA